MLLFMPWCRIDQAYTVDCIGILPYRRGDALDGLNQLQQSWVDEIMGRYKTIEGEPIHSAAVLCFPGKAPIDELTEAEVKEALDLADLICFSGLARRRFLEPASPYCNRDCFTLYSHKFSPTDYGALTFRRRQERVASVWLMDKVRFQIPIHCHHEVTIDENLLESLVQHRAESAAKEWARWESSISCFNQANSDSDNIRAQVEWVLMVGAFQHLLAGGHKAKNVAVCFSQKVVPHASLEARSSLRGSTQWKSSKESLRYEWMYEFCRIRNDFAHGKLSFEQPAVWTPLEHIVLGAIAFPLLVKSLMQATGRYTLTDTDRRYIDCFEKFADTKDFLEPPPDQQNSLDTHWMRSQRNPSWQRLREAVELNWAEQASLARSGDPIGDARDEK